MPSGAVHGYLREITGHSDEVDRQIDLPYLFLGPKHRVFHHTPQEAAVGGFMIDGVRGALGGLLHVAADEAMSDDRQLKAMFELVSRVHVDDGVKVVFDKENILPKKAIVLGVKTS